MPAGSSPKRARVAPEDKNSEQYQRQLEHQESKHAKDLVVREKAHVAAMEELMAKAGKLAARVKQQASEMSSVKGEARELRQKVESSASGREKEVVRGEV